MEVTLDKIELVRDRTGVSYKEAKDALEAADGSVVDAIIAIEESIDGTAPARSALEKKDELLAKMKDVVSKGGVNKIRISRDGETVLNLPLAAGILGTVVAPWGVIIGTVAAFGFKCKIEFVKEDGSIVDLSERAMDAYDQAKEKGTDFVNDVKEKAPGFYEEIKEKAPGNLDELKAKAQETFNELKEKAPDNFEELRTMGEDAFNKAKDFAKETADKIKKDAEELKAEVEDMDLSELGEELGEPVDTVSSELEEMKREAAQGIKDFEEEVKNEQ